MNIRYQGIHILAWNKGGPKNIAFEHRKMTTSIYLWLRFVSEKKCYLKFNFKGAHIDRMHIWAKYGNFLIFKSNIFSVIPFILRYFQVLQIDFTFPLSDILRWIYKYWTQIRGRLVTPLLVIDARKSDKKNNFVRLV